MLLNKPWVREEIKDKFKNILKVNENITYPNLYLKQYVEEKIQHENAYIKKNMPTIYDLSVNLKELEEKSK